MNRKTTFLTFLFLVGFIIATSAQLASNREAKHVSARTTPEETPKPPTYSFRAYDRSYELNAVDVSNNTHLFGLEIAKKLQLLDNIYTYEEVIVPGNPMTKRVIRKPGIYESVKKIEKGLLKSVKKHEQSNEEAIILLNKVLDVAINILNAETDDFEEALSKESGYRNKMDLFVQQTHLVY